MAFSTMLAGSPPAGHIFRECAVAFGVTVASRPNPETGPFYVEGAEPGDTLVVTIDKLEFNRATAYSASLLAAYTVDPAALLARVDREAKCVTWNLTRRKAPPGLTHQTSAH